MDSRDRYRWPLDYVVLDEGRLLVRPDCLDGFRAFGWTTLDALLTAENVDVIRRLDARDNCRVTIPAESGPVHGFLKRHHVRSVRRRFLERRRHRSAHSPGLSEANAVAWCADAGVPTMSVLAAGERLGPLGASESLFMSEELTGRVAANEHWFPLSQRSSPPPKFVSDDEQRLRVIRAVATTARRLHAAGLSHSDFYLQHFFVEQPDPKTAVLIDLQRLQRLPEGWSRRRAITKDLAQFHGSLGQFQMTDQERTEWAGCYFGDDSGPREPSAADLMQLDAAQATWQRRRLRRKIRKRGRRAA